MAVIAGGGVVVGDDLAEAPQEFRQLGRIDRGVLDERNGLARLTGSHQNPEARFSHFPDVGLRLRRQCG